MRAPFLLLACFLLLVGSCVSKKGLSGPEQRKRVNDYRKKRQEEISIIGFWQEYRRMVPYNRKTKQEVSFTDTLKVFIKSDNSTRFFDMYGKITSGHFLKKDGKYQLGNGQAFLTLDKIGDTLRLGNKERISYLRRVDGFYTKPFAFEQIDIDENKLEKVDASFLKGKWKVYKKEDPSFSRRKSYLHSIDITDTHADGTHVCLARFHNTAIQISDTGFLEVEGNNLTLNLKKQTSHFVILKAKGKEIILENNSVIYYLKNWSK